MTKKKTKERNGAPTAKELLVASGLPVLGGGAASAALKALGNLPVNKVDRALNQQLLEYANKKGIQVRKGRESMGESYVFPKSERVKLERAVRKGVPIYLGTPEGPRHIKDLLGKKIVWLQKGLDTNPAQFAHEIGHIPEKPRHPRWNHATFTVPRLSQVAAPVTAVIGGRAAKTPEGAERAGKAGALVSLIGSLPMLLSEASASAKGVKIMRERGATRGQALRLGMTRMVPHFGTYMAMAAIPALASVLIGKAYAKSKKKEEK